MGTKLQLLWSNLNINQNPTLDLIPWLYRSHHNRQAFDLMNKTPGHVCNWARIGGLTGTGVSSITSCLKGRTMVQAWVWKIHQPEVGTWAENCWAVMPKAAPAKSIQQVEDHRKVRKLYTEMKWKPWETGNLQLQPRLRIDCHLVMSSNQFFYPKSYGSKFLEIWSDEAFLLPKSYASKFLEIWSDEAWYWVFFHHTEEVSRVSWNFFNCTKVWTRNCDNCPAKLQRVGEQVILAVTWKWPMDRLN